MVLEEFFGLWLLFTQTPAPSPTSFHFAVMSVVTWGSGKSGALGSGQQVDQLLPVVIGGQLQGKHGNGVPLLSNPLWLDHLTFLSSFYSVGFSCWGELWGAPLAGG